MRIEDLIQKVSDRPEQEVSREQRAGIAGTLKEAHQSMEVEHKFEVGDLVQFKPRMAIKKMHGGVAIVRRVLDEPIVSDEQGSGTPYFREPLDIILGLLDKSGDFLEYHMDSRRLEPYTGPMPEEI